MSNICFCHWSQASMGFFEIVTFSKSLLLLKYLMEVMQIRISKHFLSYVVYRQRSFSILSRYPCFVIFLKRPFSIKGSLQSKIVLHKILSSINVCLSIEGCLPSKVFFHQFCLYSKFDFFRRSSRMLEHEWILLKPPHNLTF